MTFVYQLIQTESLKVIKVWALPRSLATTNGIIGYFLFLWVLRCFSSPAYRVTVLYIQTGATGYDSSGVSPFGHLRIKAYLAANRSLSQLVASFFGILRQGILCARLSNFLRVQDESNHLEVQLTGYWYLLLFRECGQNVSQSRLS
jgi:hypothetical protein